MKKMCRQTKNKIHISLSIKLFYFLIISILIVSSFSMARYRTSINGNLNTTAAIWTFKANEKSSETFTIDLAKTLNTSTLYDQTKDVICPGASGSFDLVIDCSESQVAIDYKIKIFTNSNSDLPYEMMFYSNQMNNGRLPLINRTYSDGSLVESERLIEGTMTLNDIKTSPIKTYTINWLWQVNMDRNESKYEDKNFYVDVTITGTQKLD